MPTWFYYFYYRNLQWYHVPYHYYPRAASPLQFSVGVNLATIVVIIGRLVLPSMGDTPIITRLFIGILVAAGCFFVSLFLVGITLWVTEKTIVRRCQEFEQESREERARRGRITSAYFWGTYILYVFCLLV